MRIEAPVLLKKVDIMHDCTSVADYKGCGGFVGFHKALHSGQSAVLDELELAELRGRGGAAIQAHLKWRQLYEMEIFPKYIVCNADEGESGTFKDKILLRDNPLSVIEGMLIAGYVFGAKHGYIYIRGEYRKIQDSFQIALDNAKAAGYLGEKIQGIEGFDYDISIVSGSGAYVCGENSALLNSIEARAGRPRLKIQRLAQVGLFKKPTLVNNVESFACIPVIMEYGGAAFKEMGTSKGGGTKLVCLSGHAKNKGVYEINLGTPLNDLLYSEKFGGGTASGRPIKFVHFGGQSGPIGFEPALNFYYSYEGLWDNGLAMGSGAIVVMDESVSVVEYCREVMRFFVHESCGKCTPCRLGTTRALELLERFAACEAQEGDIERLEQILINIRNLSQCGLGQSADTAVMSAIKGARHEFEACISKKGGQV